MSTLCVVYGREDGALLKERGMSRRHHNLLAVGEEDQKPSLLQER